jgi:hypothetical protein
MEEPLETCLVRTTGRGRSAGAGAGSLLSAAEKTPLSRVPIGEATRGASVDERAGRAGELSFSIDSPRARVSIDFCDDALEARWSWILLLGLGGPRGLCTDMALTPAETKLSIDARFDLSFLKTALGLAGRSGMRGGDRDPSVLKSDRNEALKSRMGRSICGACSLVLVGSTDLEVLGRGAVWASHAGAGAGGRDPDAEGSGDSCSAYAFKSWSDAAFCIRGEVKLPLSGSEI